ncbi:hypothetical protein Avbf_04444 [Armadillidium vulgare]|nr:hypothetical protein Avbf_04444 [Armadillidium vulgare]
MAIIHVLKKSNFAQFYPVNGYSTSWFKSLDNLMITSDNFAIGTTISEINLNEILDSYCRSLPCDFVKSHPSSLKRKQEQNHSSSRFLWQMKNIPFDGIPFCVISHEILKCKFSMNYNTKISNLFTFSGGCKTRKTE